jgi:hypothetical protein
VGVTNANGTSAPMSYTLLSRGIGAGQSLPVTTVDFAGGTAAQTDLAPREVAYYKVTVPAGQTSWQVKLSATTGDVALAVNQGYVPSVGSRGNTVLPYGVGMPHEGMWVAKPGDEHYLLLPTYATNNGQTETTIPAGDYYLAVISEGAVNVGANTNRVGTGNAGYTLLSRGPAQTVALGSVVVGGADLVKAGETLGGGAVKFYTFTVPAGLASVQVSLEDRTGNPLLGLPAGPERLGRGIYPNNWPNFYGLDDGGAGRRCRKGRAS